MFEIILERKKPNSFLKRLSKKDQKIIGEKIEILKQSPKGVGTKKIINCDSLRRIKAGSYRILYNIICNEKLIRIINIGHRKNIYSNF